MVETILDVQANEAQEFFLRQSSYCNIGLPSYFDFQKLLNEFNSKLSGNINAKCQKGKQPKLYDDVNYHFFQNKDGRFDWRPLQIINPVVYVYLVKTITEPEKWKLIKDRFNEFRNETGDIQCYSIPLLNHSKDTDAADTIKNWWSKVEQKSLEYAMSYRYLLNTDITDCYGSIYTHTITWAMCDKKNAKEILQNPIGDINEIVKQRYVIGNEIDNMIQSISYQQTNGIPQGSVLMDFIAEMVLGYADLELSKKLEKLEIDYKIIRYRDDYRIFGQTQEDVIIIAKLLTEVLSDLNFRLNTQKTIITQDLISGAIKPDKLYYITHGFRQLESIDSGYTLQKQLLCIYNLSQEHPNSGALQKAMELLFKRLCEVNSTDLIKEALSSQVLISIVTNIAFNNPKVYKQAVAIVGKILSYESDENVVADTYAKILNKFKHLPNIGYLEIWLQRLTIKFDRNIAYNDKLCQCAADAKREGFAIWNISWLKPDVQKIFENNSIINEERIKDLSETIEYKEIETFINY